MTPRSRHLPVFVALSLVAHVLLLAVWRAESARESQEYGTSALGDGTLTVALSPRPEPGTPILDPAPRHEADVARDELVTTVRRSVDTVSVTRETPRSREPRDVPLSQAVHNYLLGKVRTELTRYFQYPALARERGWEGQVVLGFSIQADGHLEKIHVARSSGYHILDESARAALGKVNQITETEPWLDGRAIDLQLPVIYRLLDR